MRFTAMLALCASGVPVLAQSPNTAALVVVVVDQTGAVVPGAQVTVVNTATGARRETTAGSNRSVTIAGLQLTGTYKVSVSKAGFTTEDIQDVALRAGETASVRVKLMASGGRSDVTVYGTTAGVRAGPELGTRLDSETIDETPILSRKISALPLLNASFRQAKGTGDLFLNSVYFVTGAGRRNRIDATTGFRPKPELPFGLLHLHALRRDGEPQARKP